MKKLPLRRTSVQRAGIVSSGVAGSASLASAFASQAISTSGGGEGATCIRGHSCSALALASAHARLRSRDLRRSNAWGQSGCGSREVSAPALVTAVTATEAPYRPSLFWFLSVVQVVCNLCSGVIQGSWHFVLVESAARRGPKGRLGFATSLSSRRGQK